MDFRPDDGCIDYGFWKKFVHSLVHYRASVARREALDFDYEVSTIA